MAERTTQVMVIPGISCALCGEEGSPGLHIPVMTPKGQPKMPRVCQACLSVLMGVTLQLLGHAGAQVAAVAVNVHSTGYPQLS